MSSKLIGFPVIGSGGKVKATGKPIQPVSTKSIPVKPPQTRNQAKQQLPVEPTKFQNSKNIQTVGNRQIKPVVTKQIIGSRIQTKKSPGKQMASKKSNQIQKRSFISEEEISEMLGGLKMDRNNNLRESQESLNMPGAACLVNIAKVYGTQQYAFDKLDGKS